MILQPPIEIFEVRDRGVPNRECVVMRVNETTALTNFFVGLGFPQAPSNIRPVNDNTFWLGSGFVLSGDWVYLYTGVGKPISSIIPNQNNTVHSIYWNRVSVLFSSVQIVPFVYSIENVQIASSPEPSSGQISLGAFPAKGLIEPDQ